ncbi:hypothetical protein ANCDUO_00415 [Ancylostoma duodenale]|uniref:Uncharacterized protein n=1 Tax=Ancylostoma duodenale TaxID=51022 RepID=A0A0C2HC68_9BILA|nr:hypothetical protein ANCDUO_00415 [Ancylostoma duodenale]
MSYEVLRESESYSFVNLISDIGGQMGLWLGASVLTAIEILIFLISIVSIAVSSHLKYLDKFKAESDVEKKPDIDWLEASSDVLYYTSGRGATAAVEGPPTPPKEMPPPRMTLRPLLVL